MNPQRKVLGIIPARGGSKGLPGKNIRPLSGKPLIAWTIETALATPELNRCIVSTDDPKIASVAREHGAEVPFLRPAVLAADDTADLPVCRHALDWLQDKEDYRPDIVVWLRPTAPLRTSEDIATALRLLERGDCDCVRSVCRAEQHPYWMHRISGDGKLVPFLSGVDVPLKRQDLPELFYLNGAVDTLCASAVPSNGALFQGNIVAYEMPRWRGIDIDDESEFMTAESYIQWQHNKSNL